MNKQTEVRAAVQAHMEDFQFMVDSRLEECRMTRIEEHITAAAELQQKIQQAKARLSDLGLFNIREKKKLTTDIGNMILQVDDLLNGDFVEQEMKPLLEEAQRLCTQYGKQLTEYLDHRFPYEFAYKEALQALSVSEDHDIRGLIIGALQKKGSSLITEMVETEPRLNAFTFQKISSTLRLMTADGIVLRTEAARKAYFQIEPNYLSNTVKRILDEKGISKDTEDPHYPDEACPLPPAICF